MKKSSSLILKVAALVSLILVSAQTANAWYVYGSFLIWRGGEPANFELKAEFRIGAHNSGI